MNRLLTTTFLLASLTVPAFAANVANPDAGDTAPGYMYPAKHHLAVLDTVGNCAVIEGSQPGPGLKLIGNKNGYPTIKAAEKAFNSECKGTVPRYDA